MSFRIGVFYRKPPHDVLFGQRRINGAFFPLSLQIFPVGTGSSVFNNQYAMNIEEFREICLSVKGSSESLPFNDYTLVYKVMSKLFAFVGLRPKEGRFIANLKCDPEKSAELMEHYEGVLFGHYSDKKYWITVYLESDLPDSLIRDLIHHSADEVIKKLPRKKQDEYKLL